MLFSPTKVTLVLAAVLLLSSCASSVNRSKASSETVEPLAAPKKSEVELPNVKLSAELLSQLLTANFASHHGDSQQAADNYALAAHSTRDHRLARLAVLWGLEGKQFELARAGAELWVELDANSKDASGTLLLSQLGLGLVDEVYKGLRAKQKDKTLEEHAQDVVSILVTQKNDRTAIGVIEKYLADFPDSSEMFLTGAYIADHFNQVELATLWLEESLRIQPGADRAAQLKVNLLRKSGKPEQLTQYIDEYLAAFPNSVSMRINRAAELAKLSKVEDAYELMVAVIKDDSINVPALKYVAALAEHLGKVDRAKAYFRRVLRVNPNDDEAFWALARFAVSDENWLKAENYYQKIGSGENYFRAQLQVANMRFHTRGLRYAINSLSILEPKTERDYVDRALTRHYLLMRGHLYEEAFGAINETLAFLPYDTELRYARALVAAEINELETTEDDLRFVLSRRPEDADAMNALGYTLADQTTRYEEAKELIEAALKLRPNQGHILDSMGWVLYRLKEFDQAVEYLKRAYQSAPQAEVAAHLGEVLWESGRQEEAQAVWKEAVDNEAENPVLNKTLYKYGVLKDEVSNQREKNTQLGDGSTQNVVSNK